MFGDMLDQIAQALVEHAAPALRNGSPLDRALGNVAKAIMNSWAINATQDERRAALEALARAPESEIRASVRQFVAKVNPPELRRALARYLEQVPVAIRRSFVRRDDPAGHTAPAKLALKRSADVLPLLPLRAPRFQAGERPLVGVDLQLEKLLGIGGFGEVWKARNPQRPWEPVVALKFCFEADAARLLGQEQKTIERVQTNGLHPGIVRLRHAHLKSNPPCLEYEYVEGGDLAGLIRDWADELPLDRLQQALPVLKQIAEAVGFVHNHHTVHRDLKPANVLLQRTQQGVVVRVTDFGIGERATQQARTQMSSLPVSLKAQIDGSCTQLYASDQQKKGQPCDPRDDVYSLGVIWYQMLVGCVREEVPPDADTVLEAMGIPQEVIALLARCLAPEREGRPTNGAVLAAELALLMPPDTVQQPPVDPIEQLPMVTDWRGLCQAAARVAEQCQTRWPEAVQRLTMIQQNFQHLESALQQERDQPAEVRQQRLQEAGERRADSLIATLSKLDVLASGRSERGEAMRLPEGGLRDQVKEVRNLLFSFVRDFGRWREFPVQEGLSALAYSGKVEVVGTSTAPQAVIKEVLHPGYIKEGQTEPQRKPRVILSDVLTAELARLIPSPALPREVVNSIGMKLALIPPGTFKMGSPPDEPGRGNNEQQHEVEITKEFYLGVYAVTQAEYQGVIGTNPSSFKGSGDLPVEQVSWHDAVEFCRRLSEREKRYGRVYRLPTEAEWEYACRGPGTSYQIFNFGNTLSTSQANYDGNYPYAGATKGEYRQKTLPVHSFEPNGFGLYQMHGNIWEWCNDWYDAYYYGSSPRQNPPGPVAGSGRVIRGGSWLNDGRGCRSADRGGFTPGSRDFSLGFRVALVLSRQPEEKA